MKYRRNIDTQGTPYMHPEFFHYWLPVDIGNYCIDAVVHIDCIIGVDLSVVAFNLVYGCMTHDILKAKLIDREHFFCKLVDMSLQPPTPNSDGLLFPKSLRIIRHIDLHRLRGQVKDRFVTHVKTDVQQRLCDVDRHIHNVDCRAGWRLGLEHSLISLDGCLGSLFN